MWSYKMLMSIILWSKNAPFCFIASIRCLNLLNSVRLAGHSNVSLAIQAESVCCKIQFSKLGMTINCFLLVLASCSMPSVAIAVLEDFLSPVTEQLEQNFRQARTVLMTRCPSLMCILVNIRTLAIRINLVDQNQSMSTPLACPPTWNPSR